MWLCRIASCSCQTAKCIHSPNVGDCARAKRTWPMGTGVYHRGMRMLQLVAFCRSLRPVSLPSVVLALCSTAILASVSPASARPHHTSSSYHTTSSHYTTERHHHALVRHNHVRKTAHHSGRHHARRHHRHLARVSHRHAVATHLRVRGKTGAYARSVSPKTADVTVASSGYSSSNIVAEARRYLGGNPTSRASLWCARFMNMVLQHTGHRGTGSDMARSFASYGRRVSEPQVGAIAVMGRRGGGHVGVISGIDARGNPIVVSGNSGNRVREAPVSRGRIYAYVLPTS
jgi:uncharacterized protein (TIGR02594 family)